MRSAQTIPSTKINREQFYDCALELSSAIHMQEVMKSNSEKVDPLAVHAFVSFRLSHMPLQPSTALQGSVLVFPRIYDVFNRIFI